MISSDPDAREVAFEALLPLAKPTACALERVESAVNDERKRVTPLRKGFTTTLNAGLFGLTRFGYAVRELGSEWGGVPSVRRISSDEQATNNVFLWALGDSFVLRVKRDPVEGVHAGAQRLFAELPAEDGPPPQVCLTWSVTVDGRLVSPRFACVEEPSWTIPLGQLVAQASAAVASVTQPAGRGPHVKSKRTDTAKTQDQG